jgi:hypothetical protein
MPLCQTPERERWVAVVAVVVVGVGVETQPLVGPTSWPPDGW